MSFFDSIQTCGSTLPSVPLIWIALTSSLISSKKDFPGFATKIHNSYGADIPVLISILATKGRKDATLRNVKFH